MFFFVFFFFFLMIRRPPRSTLFPYTTSSDLGLGGDPHMRVRLRRPAEAGERHERDEGQERRFHRSIRGDAAGRVVNGPSTAWRCVVSSRFSAAKARRASCLLVLADAGRLVCGALELLPDMDLDERALLLDQDD